MLKRMGTALVFALACIFSVSGCLAGGGGTPATNKPQSSPGVGTDGGMQFNVTGITTASAFGNGFMSSTAKGVYVVVSMTVKNISSNATGSISDLNSDVLIDSTGRQYGSDFGAAMNISDSSMGTLQPGSWAPFQEAFDVASGTTPSAIVMHGGIGTSGLKISLASFSPSPVATGQ